MYVIYVNQNNRPIGWYCLSSGGITGTVLDVRLLFAPVFAKGMTALATGFFIAHNHPSGNLTPSNADKQLTHTTAVGQDTNLNMISENYHYLLWTILAIIIIIGSIRATR